MVAVSRRLQLSLVDDFDGSPASRTHTVRLDGLLVQLDLNDAHSLALQHALAPFLAVGRRPAAHPMRRGHSRPENQHVRAWARAHHLPVSDRGAIARTVIAAYEAAHLER